MRNPNEKNELNQLKMVLQPTYDITDLSSIKESVALAIRKFNAIDVLINNASYYSIRVFESSKSEEIERQNKVGGFS